ncbi:hypothetical protein [Streptococcus catagoni]|uniref:hypothetical protein n=1 Tax=Streptococcus catagoni TaxID=2654874 RepID=UPI00140DCD70|nr:hypothetical protein [Streptococcus catagoni]
MKNMRRQKVYTAITFSSLLLAAMLVSPTVKANENTMAGQAQKVNAEDKKADPMTVTGKIRKDQPIFDIAVTLAGPLESEGQTMISLQDTKGNDLSIINYQMAAGLNNMTAWFDMSHQKTGDYKVTVTIKTASNSYQKTTETIHFVQK